MVLDINEINETLKKEFMGDYLLEEKDGQVYFKNSHLPAKQGKVSVQLKQTNKGDYLELSFCLKPDGYN